MAAQDLSIVSRIRQLAAVRGSDDVYRHIGMDGSERAVSWAWLDRRAGQLAGALRERGVGPGDRIGLGLRNSPECVISVFAAWKLGAVPVPVPVRWDVPDWELERPREPPAADEVREYAKGRLAAYKVPKTVEVVAAVPRSEATKVNRGRMTAEREGR